MALASDVGLILSFMSAPIDKFKAKAVSGKKQYRAFQTKVKWTTQLVKNKGRKLLILRHPSLLIL